MTWFCSGVGNGMVGLVVWCCGGIGACECGFPHTFYIGEVFTDITCVVLWLCAMVVLLYEVVVQCCGSRVVLRWRCGAEK